MEEQRRLVDQALGRRHDLEVEPGRQHVEAPALLAAQRLGGVVTGLQFDPTRGVDIDVLDAGQFAEALAGAGFGNVTLRSYLLGGIAVHGSEVLANHSTCDNTL